MSILTLPCPACAKQNDISRRTLYDRVWCDCGQWFMISQHRNGTWYAVKVQPPVSYPRERR